MASQGFSLNYQSKYRADDVWDPLKVYCYYRVFISLLLFSIHLTRFGDVFGEVHPEMYFNISGLYLIAAFFTVMIIAFNDQRSAIQAFIIIISDIIFVSLLAYASGGVTNNLSILMVVSVAAGGILLAGQAATLVAAIAALVVLLQQFYFSWLSDTGIKAQFMQAGLLGLTFFGTSLLAQQISNRLRASELVASRQASDLADLQELNKLIIQRLRNGILVVDTKGRVRMFNEAAWSMLGMTEILTKRRLDAASPELQQQLLEWQKNNKIRSKTFRTHMSGPEINASFTQLSAGNNEDILVILEDASTTAQQAQQLKLASLGRLTAGIAHEIRNPLGAISHAAQLLSESEALNTPCLLYTSPSPRDRTRYRMPSSA